MNFETFWVFVRSISTPAVSQPGSIVGHISSLRAFRCLHILLDLSSSKMCYPDTSCYCRVSRTSTAILTSPEPDFSFQIFSFLWTKGAVSPFVHRRMNFEIILSFYQSRVNSAGLPGRETRGFVGCISCSWASRRPPPSHPLSSNHRSCSRSRRIGSRMNGQPRQAAARWTREINWEIDTDKSHTLRLPGRQLSVEQAAGTISHKWGRASLIVCALESPNLPVAESTKW